MPYPMIHLHTARRYLELTAVPQPADFLLGNLAPDAVHIRPGRLPRGIKQRAHLSVSTASYFTLEDAEMAAFRARVLQMIAENAESEAFSFRLGYGVHILTDLLWAKQIYKPYLRQYLRDETPPLPVIDAYRADAALADQLLFAKDGEDCFRMTETGRDMGLPPWIMPGETAAWLENRRAFLRQSHATGRLHYFSMDTLESFTEDAAAAIAALLREIA